MSPDATLLALLVVGHCVADFLLQTKRMVAAKDDLRWLGAHVAVVTAAHLVALLPFLSGPTVAAVAGIGLTHGLIDRLKGPMERRIPRSLVPFFVDQAMHAAVLAVAWLWLAGTPATLLPERLIDPIGRGAVVVAAFAVNWHGAGAVVHGVLRRFRLDELDALSADVAPVPGGGWTIGILERNLALTLVLIGQWSALGLLLLAKCIVGLRRGQEQAFIDHFLIGTLASLLIATLSGLLVRWLIV